MMSLATRLVKLARTRFKTWSLLCLPLIVLGGHLLRHRPAETPRAPASSVPRAAEGVKAHKPPPRALTRSGEGVITVSATGLEAADGSTTAAGEIDPVEADERLRARMTGEWEDDYQGKRRLTVQPGGTGTMVVELDGIGKKLFAARMSFDVEWNVADGHVTMKTLGGEPRSKVQLVLKLYGNEARYKILELTSDRMLLLDGDGKTRYDWRRPGTAVDGNGNQ